MFKWIFFFYSKYNTEEGKLKLIEYNEHMKYNV